MVACVCTVARALRRLSRNNTSCAARSVLNARSYDTGLYNTKFTPSENISRILSCPSTTTTANELPFTRDEWLSFNKLITADCFLQSRMIRSKRSCASLTAARTESAHNSTRIFSSSRTRRSSRTAASSAQTNSDVRVIPASHRRVTPVPPTSYLCHSRGFVRVGSSVNSTAVSAGDLSHLCCYKRPIVSRGTVVL